MKKIFSVLTHLLAIETISKISLEVKQIPLSININDDIGKQVMKLKMTVIASAKLFLSRFFGYTIDARFRTLGI